MFNDTIYKISLSEDFSNIKEDIFTWGVDLNNTNIPKHIADKINNGLKYVGAPWRYGIPYFRNGIFAFLGKDALLTYLYDLCKFTSEDLDELTNLGFNIYELKVSAYSSGFSTMKCLLFDDEILNISKVNYYDISNNPYNHVVIETAAFPDATKCKRLHYDSFKFKVNFK